MSTSILRVNGSPISVDKEGYICLTDMAKTKAGETKVADIISGWLKTKSAIEYLGLWEMDNNILFKVVDFNDFKISSGKKHFRPSVTSWIETTNATGMYVKAGKYGGVYAHKDIAYEFGTAISVEFRYLLIKEYQRLKEAELNKNNPEWNTRRTLSKDNYLIQTDAIKNYKIPVSKLPQTLHFVEYTEEADILNIALFGFDAKEWRENNISLAAKKENPRFYASTNELKVLASLETINAEMIKSGIDYNSRLTKLKRIATEHLAIYNDKNPEQSFRKTMTGTFMPYFKDNINNGMFPIDDTQKVA